jgi:hypothetical protein
MNRAKKNKQSYNYDYNRYSENDSPKDKYFKGTFKILTSRKPFRRNEKML